MPYFSHICFRLSFLTSSVTSRINASCSSASISFFILSCSLYYCVKLIYLYRKTGSWQIKYLRTRQFLAVDHFVNQKLLDPAQILNRNLFAEDSGSVVGNNRKVISAGCRVDGNFDRFDVCFFISLFLREKSMNLCTITILSRLTTILSLRNNAMTEAAMINRPTT